MGCMASAPADARRRPESIGEVAVFVPGIRLPRTVDFSILTGAGLPEGLVGRVSALRTRIGVLAAQEALVAIKPRRRRPTRHGGYAFGELRQALEQYLPLLLGLAEDGSLRERVMFVWANQEDDAEETAMANAWYEERISDERKRKSVDVFLKAAGYLDCTIRHVLPLLPSELRSALPVDLTEEVLRALCMQALGQGVDVQIGMAIDSPKATLAVKRRLACEMVKYWHQAHDNIMKPQFNNGWGEKHQLYVKWKYAEAKATAYYYHGLMLNEGNSEKSQGTALVALHTAEEIFVESNKACKAFHVAPPKSRNPPLWGSMKYLSEKLPKDTSSKVQINQDLYNHERILETAPTLPDFALSLKPDEYSLPTSDSSWKKEDNYQLKT